MPPKPAKKTEPSKKTIQKTKEKVIEDKTFGMKNKKGKKQQEYIKTVEQQIKHGNQKKSKIAEDEKKKKTVQEEIVFNKPVMTQKVPFGVDPKSVVCSFFKVGQCKKGDKCKFSHDLSVERKSAKIDIYSDTRADQQNDTMDQWDQNKLEEVVLLKQEGINQNKKTDIVCKYFIEAIEKSLYGWFWECPNGGNQCQYRHALPPGFVLKKDKKAMEEQAEVQTLEELIEIERQNLPENLTPVTLETLMVWREAKKLEKESAEKDSKKKREDAFRAGKGQISGRELFQFKPELFQDDECAMGEEVNAREGKQQDEEDYENAMANSSSSKNPLQNDVDETLFDGDDLENLDLESDENEENDL